MKFEDCYEKAPRGAPDKFVLTREVRFRWADPPGRALALAGGRSVSVKGGTLSHSDTVPPCLFLDVGAGFHFAITVAPSFRRSLAAACLHDFLYLHSGEIAGRLGCSARDVLYLADSWFLSQMHADGFLLKRTYYAAVRTFGYAFRRIFS